MDSKSQKSRDAKSNKSSGHIEADAQSSHSDSKTRSMSRTKQGSAGDLFRDIEEEESNEDSVKSPPSINAMDSSQVDIIGRDDPTQKVAKSSAMDDQE